jgi:hypothetical protein
MKHVGLKGQFLCPFCGKSFAKKANLEAHVTLHTGEKRLVIDSFAIPNIGKKFWYRYLFTGTT